MKRQPMRYMVLLLDFDGRTDRRETITKDIPEELRDRVFLIGVWSRPEALRAALRTAKGEPYRTLEEIGAALAEECRNDQSTLWNHDLLKHNSGRGGTDEVRSKTDPFLINGSATEDGHRKQCPYVGPYRLRYPNFLFLFRSRTIFSRVSR